MPLKVYPILELRGLLYHTYFFIFEFFSFERDRHFFLLLLKYFGLLRRVTTDKLYVEMLQF